MLTLVSIGVMAFPASGTSTPPGGLRMTANTTAGLTVHRKDVAPPVRVPLALLGLALLLGFVVMAYTAATTSYLPFDVPVTLWLQSHLGGLASWFGAITALNGTRQTLAGILLLVVILIVNPPP
jgi:hypothetical protein